MLQSDDQLTTPTTGESRRRKRKLTPSSDTSPTNLPPPCKLTVRMSTEFADSLLAALEEERIARRLIAIITASVHQKLYRQAEEIAELKQEVAAMEERQTYRILLSVIRNSTVAEGVLESGPQLQKTKKRTQTSWFWESQKRCR